MAKEKTLTATQRPRLAAVDNGYADHKVAWYDDKGRIMTLKIPAILEVSTGGGLRDPMGNPQDSYKVGNTPYTCNPSVRNPVKLRNADYPVSVENRVLVTHGLAKAGLLGTPIRLGVTLPYRDYFHGDGSLNQELKVKTCANFMSQDVEVVGSAVQPNILSVNAYSEALCGYFDWAVDDHGQIRKEAEDIDGEVAIVDIGGSTTDIVSLHLSSNGLVINNASSGTDKAGVLDAREMIDQKVREHLRAQGIAAAGHDQELPAWVMGKVLETGGVRYQGQYWDLQAIRDQACGSVAQRISHFIRTKLGNLGNYQAIIVIGGGAMVFREHMASLLPGAIYMDEFSNARGALKYMSNWENFGG